MMLKNHDRPRSRINKSLNISFYIVYGMSTQKNKTRLGPRQVEILTYLQENGGQAWESDLLARFVYAGKYQRIFLGRLYGLQEKGLISIRVEINPDTGRQKKKVYLVK